MRWVASEPGEFIVGAAEYGLRWHTEVHNEAADKDALFAQQAMRLGYLRRKFYEGLKAGRKIYTIARADPRKHDLPMPDADELPYWEEKPENLHLAELLPLFMKINEYGTNTLLYLTHAVEGKRPGTVDLIAPGVMRGYVGDFVIFQDMTVQDHAVWMRIAANAWLLHQNQNAPFWKKDAV
jgi:hypothetical protein